MTYESIHNANPPTPVLANYLWAGFFPLAYVGVMMLMRQEVRKFTAANYLDGVVVTLTCAAAFAAFAFGFIQKAVGDDAVTVAWNLIYPVGDILLLILTLGAAALVPAGRRKRWYLMAAASLVNAIGRRVRAVRQWHRRHSLRLFLELDCLARVAVSVLAVGVGHLAPAGRVRAQGNESGCAIPGVAAGLALLILFVGSLNHINQIALGLAVRQRSWLPVSASAWR